MAINYLSREEELRKLNDELEKEIKKTTTTMTTSAGLATTRATTMMTMKKATIAGTTIGQSPRMSNDRFATYTKCKAPMNNSRRNGGAGDYVSPPKSPTINSKERYGNGFNQRFMKSMPRGNDLRVNAEEHGKPRMPTRQYPENSARNSNLLEKYLTSSSKAKETVLKYKNDKFSSSPSLDNMIKDDLKILEKINREDDGRNSSYSQEMTARTLPSESLVVNGKKFLNASSLIRFLKSKVTLLEENQTRNMQEMSQQKEAYDQAMERQKVVQQQRDKALMRNNTLMEQLEKTTTQLNESDSRFRQQTQESMAQQKELEVVKRELKQLTLANSGLEKRYTRVKEELESLQDSYSIIKEIERDLKEAMRRETELRDSEIKHLRKQRADLFKAYKKQLFLIDNLRQQNVCLEQSKMIDFCEKEFGKVLEWNSRS